ncbi:AAA family ATPase [Pengzhenrongella sicca]|uniref:MinD-like ATPase involved in chromosome partitioning or flagellar assembly n=1 Tax=Pengzhenrongella sicca TaxID=2819238 RepID=A0A8A4ZE96_9MICO|nr:hypothetical protein [Pengzhenrongella sicca]QTE30292.1 hypothetical protein J4E96_04620 [Pengzhenrongella sicca]
MSVGVLCAVRGQGETGVVTALDGASGQLSVERRCADLAELLAAAAAGVGALAVVSADLPHLDRDAVAQLHLAGVRVLVLTEPGPGHDERMLALGVDAVLGGSVSPAALVAAVLALAETGGTSGAPAARPASTAPAGGEPTARPVASDDGSAASDDGAESGPADLAPAPAGLVVAVWGPAGAPGRTTVAINLAAELTALAPGGALLVDADTYGGTVAQLLGMLDESPGLAAAARAAGQGGLDLAALARLTPRLLPGLRVLTGISRANRWPELGEAALEVVWERARDLAAWTVIDCGFCLEQDEALSYDTRAPRRNAATLSALEAADVVVVVGSGDPVGIQRLVRGLADLALLPTAGAARRLVVVNRLRASAAGPRPGASVRESLARYAGVRDPHLVPDDRLAVDAATLRGTALRESAPGAPARRAIAALAAAIAAQPKVPHAPVPARGRRARRRGAGR